jgi:hypothetical protein
MAKNSVLLSTDWRMPADTDPAATRSNGYLIVDVQGNNRTPPHSAQAEEAYPGRVPSKVLHPLMLTGMIQWCEFAAERIAGTRRYPFEFITATAGKAEVVKPGLAALGFRGQVIHDHGLTRIGLCGLTVGAPMVIGIDQLLAQRFREIGTHGEATTSRRGGWDARANGARLRHAPCGA